MEYYFVVEVQNNTAITNGYNSLPAAMQAFHLALSYAAVSDVNHHGAYLFDNRGNLIDQRFFDKD